MARHSFIQMSKLHNVKGRISYITNPARQENLYAIFHTADNTFWSNLARESQQEFRRSGTDGKCIEARELIIALPEVYTRYDPQQLLENFTEKFHKQYGVECVSALHHNKRKTNYHIHLIFSERTLLPEPEIKIASRNVYYDEHSKRVRTKKEISGADGKIRKGCSVIPKGEVYESHMFSVKDIRYKSESFLREVKVFYTDLINHHISDTDRHLKVFDKSSIYLSTQKIGKHNPKEEEIKADNTARQEWNRTADMALVMGITEAKICAVKQAEIHDKISSSIHRSGWLPKLFCSIVSEAKDYLQNLIRQQDMPKKPMLNIDMAEFRIIQQLMIRAQDKAREIRNLQDNVLPKLKEQLKNTTGIFKGKERKALTTQIQRVENEISEKLAVLPEVLKDDGYPDTRAFMKTYREMEGIVERYEYELREYHLKLKQKERPAKKQPEIYSVRERLRQLQQQAKQPHKKKSFDRDSR